mgnify:CR=1 FL=1
MSGTSPSLEAALNQFRYLYPETIDLSLERILHVLDRLGTPQKALPPVIHVAGTNGKGSTCAFMRAMAEAAGLRVHVSISPHLVRFNERVRLAGKLVEDAYFIDCLARVRRALGALPITYFEASMAAAFLAFSETPADLLILETGLGGRYDASNIVSQPALSVLTPIDYDHKAYLGTDLGRIAWEKAGIIKQGCPVITAPQSDIALSVISEEAFSLSAPLYVLTAEDIRLAPDQTALIGDHQRANAALAAKALKVWDETRFPEPVIEAGAATANWPARLQKLAPGPVHRIAPDCELWLDGGHNPHAARAIARHLATLDGPLQLVTAMMDGKDAAGFFAAFERLDGVHTCLGPTSHAMKAPGELAEAARQAGHDAAAHGDFETALKAAAEQGPKRILICGSLYLAGYVLAQNQQILS